MKQWHPGFSQLLRTGLEGDYVMRTTLPVGDLPREADIVLLRRKNPAPPRYRGLWRHLTILNILEYKGPTVSPRCRDIDLLVEVGLGIDRQHQEEQSKQGEDPLPPEEVSFWIIANHLGRRLLRDARRRLGHLESLGPGLWHSVLLERQIVLVSSIDLAVEEDSLPLHIASREPLATEREVARLVLERPDLQERYGGFLASLHPQVWKEIERMARATGKRLVFDIRPAIESLGWDQVLEQVGMDTVIEQIGLDRVIEQAGIDRVLQHLGKKEVIKRIGLDDFIANLSPAERRELKRRLQ
jgi:hypothetical protein